MASGHRVQGFISLINYHTSSQASDGLKGTQGGKLHLLKLIFNLSFRECREGEHGWTCYKNQTWKKCVFGRVVQTTIFAQPQHNPQLPPSIILSQVVVCFQVLQTVIFFPRGSPILKERPKRELVSEVPTWKLCLPSWGKILEII